VVSTVSQKNFSPDGNEDQPLRTVLSTLSAGGGHRAQHVPKTRLKRPLDPEQSLIEQLDRVSVLIPTVFFGDVKVSFETEKSADQWQVTTKHTVKKPEGQAIPLTLSARHGLIPKEDALSILAPPADDNRRNALQEQYDQAVKEGADRQAEELLQQIQQSPKSEDPIYGVLEEIYEQFENNPDDFVYVSGVECFHFGGEGGSRACGIALILMRIEKSVEVFPLSLGRENEVDPQAGLGRLLKRLQRQMK